MVMKFYFVFFRAASLVFFARVVWGYYSKELEPLSIGVGLFLALAFEICASLKNLEILLKKEFEKIQVRDLKARVEKEAEKEFKKAWWGDK